MILGIILKTGNFILRYITFYSYQKNNSFYTKTSSVCCMDMKFSDEDSNLNSVFNKHEIEPRSFLIEPRVYMTFQERSVMHQGF